jgi:hypothetical protein
MKTFFICLLILSLILSLKIEAQPINWHEGAVVMSTKQVITGKVAIEPRYDLVIFEAGTSRMVYPAHKVQSLYFYDKHNNVNRRFISIHDQSTAASKHQLFEVVLLGKVTVLRHQKHDLVDPSEADDFTYYCRYGDVVLPLNKFTKKVYPHLMSLDDKRLERFISENHLKASNAANSIRIIEFYNRMTVADEAIAKH